MKPHQIKILWIVYFLCVIPALITLWHRMEFDRGFNSVALVADYVQLLELAQTENRPIEDVLTKVRDDAGITHLALLEDTPQFLAQRGLCTIVEGIGWPGWKTPEERDEIERNRGREVVEAESPSTDWPLLMGLDHDMTHLVFTDPDVYRRIASTAIERYPGLVEITDKGIDGGIVSLAGEPKIILEWGMGFDPVLVEELTEQGFILYPRLRDYPGYREEEINIIFAETASMFPASFIIFDGDSVTGGHGLVVETSELIDDLGMNVGWVEFAEQRGSSLLSALLPNNTARVHSIEDEEMEVITTERAIARFMRAVRERTVRIVYLKPFLLTVDQSSNIKRTIMMFSGVRDALESRGFNVGEPSTISSDVKAGFFTRLASALALAIALILLIYSLKIRISLPTGIGILIIILAGWLLPGWSGQKIIALGLTIICPTLAVAWLVGRYDGTWHDIRNLRITQFWPTLLTWLGTVMITLTGALLIGASLINEKTLLAIDSFSGVKLALYLPILLAIFIGVRLILPEDKKNVSDGISRLLDFPLRIWHILLGLAGLVVLFIMIDRSGNFPLLPVADWENQIRGWFETALYARPRTKEIFIGHPALVLGIYLGLSTIKIRRPLMYIGVVIGSIALTSLTNTFCHIHTPVILSIYRTLASMIIGCVIGLVLGILIVGIVGKLVGGSAAQK